MPGVRGLGGGCCCGDCPGAGAGIELRVRVIACEGRVGSPIYAATVTVSGPDGEELGVGTTNVYGGYVFSGPSLPSGVYKVSVGMPTAFSSYNGFPGEVSVLAEAGVPRDVRIVFCPSTATLHTYRGADGEGYLIVILGLPMHLGEPLDPSGNPFITHETLEVPIPADRCIAAGADLAPGYVPGIWFYGDLTWQPSCFCESCYETAIHSYLTSEWDEPGYSYGLAAALKIEGAQDFCAGQGTVCVRPRCGGAAIDGLLVTYAYFQGAYPDRMTGLGGACYPFPAGVTGEGQITVRGGTWKTVTVPVPSSGGDVSLEIEVENLGFEVTPIELDVRGVPLVDECGNPVPFVSGPASVVLRRSSGQVAWTGLTGLAMAPEAGVYDVEVTAPGSGFAPGRVAGVSIGGCMVTRILVPMRRTRYAVVARFTWQCTYRVTGQLVTCPAPFYPHTVSMRSLPDGEETTWVTAMSTPAWFYFELPEDPPESWTIRVDSVPTAATRMLPGTWTRELSLDDLAGADPTVQWPIQCEVEAGYQCCSGCCHRPLQDTLVLWDDLGGGELVPTTLSHQGNAWVASYSLAGPSVLCSVPGPCVLVPGVDSPRADVIVSLHCDGDGKGRVVYDVTYSWDCEGGTTGMDMVQGVAALEDVCLEVGGGQFRPVYWQRFGHGCESIAWLPSVASVDLPE